MTPAASAATDGSSKREPQEPTRAQNLEQVKKEISEREADAEGETEGEREIDSE